MGGLSCGKAWLVMRDMPIRMLNRIASKPGFGLEEELARSMLRNKLVARRIRNAKGLPAAQHIAPKGKR